MMNKFFFIFLIQFSCYAQWQNLHFQKGLSIRSLEVYGKRYIWAGASNNSLLHSENGGKTWATTKIEVEKKAQLDFRGLKVLNKNTIVAVSAGLAELGAAKVFLSTNRGRSWQMVFNTDQAGVFLDGISRVGERLFIYGDTVDEYPYLLESLDNGYTWTRVSKNRLPSSFIGEAFFAASNSNMAACGKSVVLASQFRLFYSLNGGIDWQVMQTPFLHNESSGIFGITMIDEHSGLAIGGNYLQDTAKYQNAMRFTLKGDFELLAPVQNYGLKEAELVHNLKIYLVGTSGTSVLSASNFKTESFDSESFHCIKYQNGFLIAAGKDGRIAKRRPKY